MEIVRVIWVAAALYMMLMGYYKVMAIHPNRITIPFRPLLGQVVECLNFPEPVYGYVDKDRNNAFVRVKTECGRSEFVFFGGEANTIQESQERAAQKAILKMISHYGVRVNDFTADRARMYQLCSKLYKHKVVELCREKGLEMPTTQGNLGKRTTEDVVHVTMNYVDFLGAVVRKTGAEVSSLETIWAEGLGFVSWLTVSCPHNGTGMECIYSDPCAEVAAARQKTAKRAIHYLVTQYSLEVIDANYGLASEKGATCSDLKTKFYHFKERLAARSDRFPEGDCVTPTSERFQIPKPIVPPSAPMKRRSSAAMDTASSSAVRVTEPLVSCIPELETVWKRAKFA
uniref:Uncharacterized protein n=1 Tax=Chenopodium quinoa TaxID=63459 RepID=A0A803N479_CHEQI